MLHLRFVVGGFTPKALNAGRLARRCSLRTMESEQVLAGSRRRFWVHVTLQRRFKFGFHTPQHSTSAVFSARIGSERTKRYVHWKDKFIQLDRQALRLVRDNIEQFVTWSAGNYPPTNLDAVAMTRDKASSFDVVWLFGPMEVFLLKKVWILHHATNTMVEGH